MIYNPREVIWEVEETIEVLTHKTDAFTDQPLHSA